MEVSAGSSTDVPGSSSAEAFWSFDEKPIRFHQQVTAGYCPVPQQNRTGLRLNLPVSTEPKMRIKKKPVCGAGCPECEDGFCGEPEGHPDGLHQCDNPECRYAKENF